MDTVTKPEGTPTKTTAVKATETARKVRGLVKQMYLGAQEAKAKGIPIAYCMVASQYDEIVRASGVGTVWTENYAGLCAAKRDAERFILKAEGDGYSNVLCGYARVGIGFEGLRRQFGGTPPNAPDGGMAAPDMLLGSSSVCDPRFKWYQAMGHYADIPIHNIDVVCPPIDARLPEVRDYYVKYQRGQFQNLVNFLEQQTKKKFDMDRLWEVIRISDETRRWWWDAYQLRKAVPCPMPSEDHFNTFVPAYFMMGTPEALNFYKELYQELKTRVENKVGVIPDEKYRIIWAGGLPPWHTMWTFNYFESQGAVFVIDTSYRPFDPVEVPSNIKDPLDYLAWRTILRAIYRYEKAYRHSGNADVELLLEMVEGYKGDGLVMHASRSCRATTIGQLYLKDMVQKYVPVPCLQLISDLIDVRDYSEAQWKMQIDAFVETVAASKRGRKG